MKDSSLVEKRTKDTGYMGEVTIEPIENGYLIRYKDRSIYTPRMEYFKNLEDVYNWLFEYWDITFIYKEAPDEKSPE